MTFRSVIDLLELLDDGRTTGAQVAEYLSALGSSKVSVKRVEGDKPDTFTDFIRCEIAGTRGKISGGSAPHSASSGGLAASAPVRPAKVLFRRRRRTRRAGFRRKAHQNAASRRPARGRRHRNDSSV